MLATARSALVAISPTFGVMAACAVLALFPLRREVQAMVCIFGALTLGGTAMDAVIIVESPEAFFYTDLAILVTLFGISVFQMVIVCAPLDNLLPCGFEKIVLDPNWV